MNARSLTLVSGAHLLPTAGGDLRSITLIGNYPPRRCGIATFTADVRSALVAERPDLICDVIAMDDGVDAYAYPREVSYALNAADPQDYLAAAARIRQAAPDVVCLQHEFGIFGGEAGEYILHLLENIDVPVISTLHTILETPNDDQRRVFETILARSARVIVMAERGREMLQRVWNVAPDKIVLVPHGAPDTPMVSTAAHKAEFGFEGRDLLFTFGLLSPNKGIEAMLQAMPQIVRAQPKALYVVLGATHPSLVAREGERYRNALIALAEQLGVADNVRFIDEFTDTPRLLDYLRAADVYVTPYLNEAQITSGTLSYAASLGKAIVSTPYWHAQELLADGRGALVPFGDPDALATAVTDLLQNPAHMAQMQGRIYAHTRSMVWSRLAETYLDTFAGVARTEAITRSDRRRAGRRGARPEPSLKGVLRLTDSCGILQHSVFGLPDRNHGYCVDDNCRALLLLLRMPDLGAEERDRLLRIYASFVQHSWNEHAGHFRNFMNYERAWLESVGSADSRGRTIWTLGVAAVDAPAADLRYWARELLNRAMRKAPELTPLRSRAFINLGLTPLIARGEASPEMIALAERNGACLAQSLARNAAAGWFETFLSYDNARLAEALIRTGMVLDKPEWTGAGVEALQWLTRRQTSRAGMFRPIPTRDFGRSEEQALFDQQPLEAWATIDACGAALTATGDPRWLTEADRAYDWFLGSNDLGVALNGCGEGECYDGLTWCGVNQNRGAESVLAFQFATCAIVALTNGAHGRLRASLQT